MPRAVSPGITEYHPAVSTPTATRRILPALRYLEVPRSLNVRSCSLQPHLPPQQTHTPGLSCACCKLLHARAAARRDGTKRHNCKGQQRHRQVVCWCYSNNKWHQLVRRTGRGGGGCQQTLSVVPCRAVQTPCKPGNIIIVSIYITYSSATYRQLSTTLAW